MIIYIKMGFGKFKFVLWTLDEFDNKLAEIKKMEVKYQWSYIVCGRENCPTTHKEHIDGYYEMKTPRKISTELNKWNKRFGKGFGKIEIAGGSAGENFDYSEKEKKEFYENGAPAKQGVRIDLAEAAATIERGETFIDEIALENPMLFHMYGRTLTKIEDIVMRKKNRGGKFFTKGIWYFGATGAGKSHKAFDGLKFGEYYNVPKDGRWWDAYKQQKTVIINDFRGHIAYDDMLNMVDKWDYDVCRRGREPMPFTSELVIVTSSKTPEEVYCNRTEEDSIEQLLRRFTVYECKKDGTTTVWSGNIRADHRSKLQNDIGDNW